MKIKVLHVVLSLGTGGLENGIVNTINGSDTSLYKIDVVCLRELGELANRINNVNTEIFYDETKKQGLKNAIKVIREANAKNRYDIIHTHGWSTMLAGYIAKLLDRNYKIINGEHGTLYLNTFRQRVIQKFLFNRMTINLSVSGALAKEITSKLNLNNSRFIPILNGVETSKFHPNSEARSKIRKELNLSDKDLIVGSVGRLVPVKNYPSLLRAFSLVIKQQKKARLVFAGDGPERAKLEEVAAELGVNDNVIFLGRRDDIPDVMNALDVFVLPSFREGLSNTILEAMATGLPAIVSCVGGSPEIVIEGETGHLFEVDDVQLLSKRILNLFENSDQLETISKQAQVHVVNNYSLETMVNNYQKVYSDIMNNQIENS